MATERFLWLTGWLAFMVTHKLFGFPLPLHVELRLAPGLPLALWFLGTGRAYCEPGSLWARWWCWWWRACDTWMLAQVPYQASAALSGTIQIGFSSVFLMNWGQNRPIEPSLPVEKRGNGQCRGCVRLQRGRDTVCAVLLNSVQIPRRKTPIIFFFFALNWTQSTDDLTESSFPVGLLLEGM